MMYKNSFKLIFSNSNLVWKLLVYLVICLFLCGSLAYAVNTPILEEIGIAQVFSKFPDIFTEFIKSFEMSNFLVAVQNMFEQVISIVVNDFAKIWYLLLIIAIVSIIIPSIVFNFYLMSTCNVLHNYMGSNVNFGFTASIFVNFWKNIKYNIVCLITILPIKLITYLAVIESFALLASENIILRVFAPFVITAIYVILTSIRVTIFSGWVPHMVVKNRSVWHSLIFGFKNIRKRFFKILGSSVCIVLTILLISVFGILTFGVSLIITAPAAYLLIATFNMVSFYTSTGLRFYVDNNNVFAPKKAEMVENFKIYKNII